MSDFTVSITELRNKMETLQQLNEQFKSEVNAMEETEGGLNGMWEGEAREAFHTAFHKDKTQMDNFYNAIAQYVARLETIADKYEQAEANNVEIATERTYG